MCSTPCRNGGCPCAIRAAASALWLPTCTSRRGIQRLRLFSKSIPPGCHSAARRLNAPTSKKASQFFGGLHSKLPCRDFDEWLRATDSGGRPFMEEGYDFNSQGNTDRRGCSHAGVISFWIIRTCSARASRAVHPKCMRCRWRGSGRASWRRCCASGVSVDFKSRSRWHESGAPPSTTAAVQRDPRQSKHRRHVLHGWRIIAAGPNSPDRRILQRVSSEWRIFDRPGYALMDVVGQSRIPAAGHNLLAGGYLCDGVAPVGPVVVGNSSSSSFQPARLSLSIALSAIS